MGKDISKSNEEARRVKNEAEGKKNQMNETIKKLKEELKMKED